MKISVEHLYHFSCSACNKWWTVADYKWELGKKGWCPHCGQEFVVDEPLLTGDDFNG